MRLFLTIVVLLTTAIAVTLLYHQTQQADINYYQGRKFFEKGEYDKAMEFYEKALAINPSHKGALKDLAYSCQWTGDFKRAIEVFNQILSMEPDDYKIMLALAEALAWNKEYEKSSALCEEIIDSTGDIKAQILLGQVYIWNKQFDAAKEVLEKVLSKDPENTDARIGLAEILSWQKKYDESINEYKTALEIEPDNLEAKRKLADVLSWDKQYRKALDLYDETLAEKEDVKVRLQKARVLGWAREYEDSIKEYEKALQIIDNSQIALEKRAKKAYWNNRIRHAIQYYSELIEKEPENVEAMFDLSQIYSYQSMREKAVEEYKRILGMYPGHFRAKEGLQKAELISGHIAANTGYEFFEADSQDRVNDIKRHTFFNRLRFPVNYNLQIDADYNLTGRSFSDFGDVLENEGRIGVNYLQSPDWRISGFYNFIDYNKGIDTMHAFGGNFNHRVFDIGVSSFSFERERLENSSTVIKGNYYADNYKERLDIDIAKRFKLGLDYLFSNYSDGNYRDEPGIDALYYISFEPKRFSIKYRYFYRVFDEKMPEYFSPHSFWTNKITFNWKHFLNKEEIFFGADDLYYDLKYDAAVDSGDTVSHRFSAGFNWDVNKNLNLSIKGSITNSSADVYEDKNAMAAIKYYF